MWCFKVEWREFFFRFSINESPFDNIPFVSLCFHLYLVPEVFFRLIFENLFCLFISIIYNVFLLTQTHTRKCMGARACVHARITISIGTWLLEIPIDVLSFMCCVCHFILFGQIHRINIIYWLAIHTMIIMFGINNNLYNVLWLNLCVFH